MRFNGASLSSKCKLESYIYINFWIFISSEKKKGIEKQNAVGNLGSQIQAPTFRSSDLEQIISLS